MKAHLAREYDSVEAATEALIDQAGGAKRVAFTLGKSISCVYAYADPKAGVQMTLGQVATLTRPGVDSAAQWLAHLAGGEFLLLPAGDGDGLGAECSDLAREAGEFLAEAVRDLADGKVSAQEARRLKAEIDGVLRVCARIRPQLDRIIKSGQHGEGEGR